MRNRHDVINDAYQVLEWWRVDHEKLTSEIDELRKIVSELEKRIAKDNIDTIHSVADRYKFGYEKHNDGYLVYHETRLIGFVKQFSSTLWVGETISGKNIRGKTMHKTAEMMING
jgi:hypothetical protein